jgi:hypothetical protein
MRIFIKRIVYCIIILCLLLTFTGCSNNESKIVGKWKCIKSETIHHGKKTIETNPSVIFEFLSDNTVLPRGGFGGGQGRWTILSDGRVKIDFGLALMFGSFDGSNLILTGEAFDGSRAVLTLIRTN